MRPTFTTFKNVRSVIVDLFNHKGPNFRLARVEFVALCALLLIAVAAGQTQKSHASDQPDAYNAASHGTQNLTLGPASNKLLLDKSNLRRDDIKIGEMNVPAGFDGNQDPAHG